MTREQAIARLLVFYKNENTTAALVDSLVALDLLKLDPPEPKKSAHELIVTTYEKMRADHPFSVSYFADTVITVLRDAGYLTSA